MRMNEVKVVKAIGVVKIGHSRKGVYNYVLKC